MNYFINLYKYTCCFRRAMSSFKLSLWENSMFVNYVVLPGDINKKLMISMLTPLNNKKRINFCRNLNDTIQIFIDRLCIKLLVKHKKSQIIDILIKVDGVDVSGNSICSEIFTRKNSNITIQIDKYLFKVIIDAPLINELKLHMPPYKGLMFYPYAFDKGYNVSILDNKYLWYRIDSKNLIEVGNKITYTPTENDVGFRLKLVCNPYNEGQFGPTAEIISLPVKENAINIYPFENRLKTKPNNSIRVVSYNLLAADYTKTNEAKNEMYPYCSEEVLSSSYRNPIILKELITYKGDILCLQEVESKFFNRELNPLLQKFLNMNGLFFKKNSREGLGCFYSSNKFVLLKELNIQLYNLDTMKMYCGSIIQHILDDKFWKEGLVKKIVLQVLVLELISDQKQLFLICNTHLISDPKGDAIRLFQALIELIIINKIKNDIINDYPECKLSIIFCGDFNSTPESGVYDLITKLLLPEEYNDVKILNDLKCILVDKMHSAYDIDVKYSNYTQTFSGLLDYIYFTNKHIECIQTLSMPTHEEVTKNVGLPSILFPSDHLALIADFEIK